MKSTIRRSRFIRAVLDTPFELSLSLMSVYIGITILVFGETVSIIPHWLYACTAASVALGGCVTFVARVGRAAFVRAERAGLALLVAAYGLFPTYYLSRAGVDWLSVQGVIAEYAVASGFAIRCWTLGISLRAGRRRS